MQFPRQAFLWQEKLIAKWKYKLCVEKNRYYMEHFITYFKINSFRPGLTKWRLANKVLRVIEQYNIVIMFLNRQNFL